MPLASSCMLTMVMIKVYHIDHQDHCSCAQVHTGAAVTLMLILRLLACDVAHQQTKDLARCARNNAKMPRADKSCTSSHRYGISHLHR